jgi:hypothetical protein
MAQKSHRHKYRACKTHPYSAVTVPTLEPHEGGGSDKWRQEGVADGDAVDEDVLWEPFT